MPSRLIAFSINSIQTGINLLFRHCWQELIIIFLIMGLSCLNSHDASDTVGNTLEVTNVHADFIARQLE